VTDVAPSSPSAVLPIVDAAEAGFATDRVSRIAVALEQEVAQGRLPGAVVAVARGGRMLAPITAGYRNPATRAPMPADAVFSIASMTKPMTSVAILQLVEDGRVLLGDPVGRYIPQLAEFRVAVLSEDDRPLTVPARRQPTIQDLLRHTSGLTYRDRGRTFAHRMTPGSSISAPAVLSREAFLAKLGETPLLFEPGTDWEYGFSTDVLGLVVEAVTKQRLSDALRQSIWAPLGLSDCAFDLGAAHAERYALAFPTDPLTGTAQSVHHAPPATRQLWESGGGGALATAADYLRFAEMLRQGGQLGEARILGRKTVQLMTADHLGTEIRSRIADSMDPAAAGYGFGLGLAVRRQDGVAAMPGSAGDFYWSGVYGTYFWVDPAEELSVVFMAAVPGLLRLRYRQLVRALVYQALR
jgi:CubicO group peptidase (beta-lactamase class C family)